MKIIHLHSFPVEHAPEDPQGAICGSKDPDSVVTDDENQVNCHNCLHQVIRTLRAERNTWRDAYHVANLEALAGQSFKAKVKVVRERVEMEIANRVAVRFGLNLHSVQGLVHGAFNLLESSSD